MSEFKAMKFWVNGDKELRLKVRTLLKEMGYREGSYGDDEFVDEGVVLTHDEGVLDGYNNPSEAFFKGLSAEEINIDWLRTPKQETIELNGKNYIKADVEAALEKLKPVN